MESKRVEEDYKALVATNTFSAVYQSITQRCHSYRYTCAEAKKAGNKPLNRYRDVNPYDHSRIILRREGFNYINANLVKVERANRQYILTQGPLVYTSGHFWLMIWEQKSPAIIMLNRVIENLEVKCHWYWPHEEEKGVKAQKPIPYTDVNLTVSQVSEQYCNYYVIRKLRLLNHETGETRDIWQFHYTTWPDFGVPESPHAFLVFLKHVNDYNALDGTEGPAVIHCSAGIGRSGTFCLVDSVLVMVQNEGQANVDVQEVLLEMRRYRMGLIQTSEQFRFSYKAIIEGIKRMDPDYEPNSDVVPEPEQGVPRQGEEAPPPPPPRGESLGQPPARPLPAIPASASMGMAPLPVVLPPLAGTLYQRRRAMALSNAVERERMIAQGQPALAEMPSGMIYPRAMPPPSLAPLPVVAAALDIWRFPAPEQANPLPESQENEQDLSPDNSESTLEDVSSIQTVYENVDTLCSDSSEDSQLQNTSDDISSEELATYNTSGELENAEGMELDNAGPSDGPHGINIIDLSSSLDSDSSDPPPTPLPRPASTKSDNIIELSSSLDSDSSDPPPTPPPRPASTKSDSPGSSYEEIVNEDDESSESEVIVGGSERSGLRRRNNAALADRVAEIRKRSRKADNWNAVKRSFLKPLAISFSVGLLAVAGVLIYSYTHRH